MKWEVVGSSLIFSITNWGERVIKKWLNKIKEQFE